MTGSQHARESNDECLCTVPLFCLSPLSLQFVVCFCSVVHRTVYTLTRSCLSPRTIHDLVAWLKIQRLRRPHKLRSSPCHPFLHLHMSVPHSHLLPRSLHQEQPLRSSCRSTNAAPLRQEEESGSLAKTTSPTVSKRPEEREFDADSGESMHMLSKRDLCSEEMEILRSSRNPTGGNGQ